MKKRVWSLFLALALCLAMMPQTALAEAGGENAAGGREDNVHAVAAQTADGGNTNGTAGIKATIGDTAYTEISAAVAAWLASGGTLTLHADASTKALKNFYSAKAKNLVIDLNGHRIDDDNDENFTPLMLNDVNLTIRDSKQNDSEQGAFGTIVAKSGSLTLESGYIKGLTVRGARTQRQSILEAARLKLGNTVQNPSMPCWMMGMP